MADLTKCPGGNYSLTGLAGCPKVLAADGLYKCPSGNYIYQGNLTQCPGYKPPVVPASSGLTVCPDGGISLTGLTGCKTSLIILLI